MATHDINIRSLSAFAARENRRRRFRPNGAGLGVLLTALGSQAARKPEPDKDAALLALREEYDLLRAEYDSYNAGACPEIEDSGATFDAFCMMVGGMPARTPGGLAFKARVALAQLTYVDDNSDTGVFPMLRALLGEVAAAGEAA